MMTTSYPHNPGMHPQGMPHGHPMGGPGPNQGQQMPPGMHPGVSGPNGPVSQAGPMMGMQPGMGGPNAHALQHLQPQQAHMFAQQQQQQGHPGMMNPALMQQRNAQQQAFLQHRHQQAMMAQQQQGGMGMGGFQNPMPNMQNMNPQQMAQMQQRMNQQPFGVNLPNHLQVLQQQQQQMSNQQQAGPQQAAAIAQAQAAQAAHAQQQHMAQQQQQHQQAQAIAMQQAHSQQSNHSQNASQGPPTTSQPQQGPLRPPSAMSHQGHTSPAPPPTPQQQPPPQQQQPPPQQQQQPQQSGPQPGQQTPAPVQPANLPQQPNQQQPQNPAQMQQRNPAMVQQAQAQAQAQAVQAQAAQARNMAMMKQQNQQATGGQWTLKLMNFVDQIGRFNSNTNSEENKVERWQTFVDKFFADTGSFIHCVYHTASERTKQFEIVYAALPRYFYTLFNTDVTNLQITLDGANEKTSPNEVKVTCDRAKFIYTYRNQCQVVYTGKLTAFWSQSDKMEWLLFEGTGHQQFIPRSALEHMFHQPSPNQMNPNQSPRMSKNAKLKQQRAAEPPEPYLPFSKLPTAGVTEFGLPPVLQSYLEIYETMNNMTSLMAHYLDHAEMKPSEALEHWNSMMAALNAAPMGQQNPGQNQGQQMQQPNMPPGVRPPGPGQPGQHMFMSPAMQNQLLPNGMNGSPGMMHTPSPNSHPMVKQQSTSSHTASVNTSPNMQKRRRSTAKIDLDDGEMNGAKVKQSPRVGGGKRMKGGN